MRDFKVITNTNPPSRNEDEYKEVELQLLAAENMADLYFASEYFPMAILEGDGFYFVDRMPEDEMDISDFHPLLESNFDNFVKSTRSYRTLNSVSLGSLIMMYDASEDGFAPLVDSVIQESFFRFFRQALMILNPDLIYAEDSDEILEAAMEAIGEEGYYDEVFQGILGFLDETDNLRAILFDLLEENEEEE